MSLHKFAQEVASRGRGDDSLLIHMTPDEVQRLQQFAQANGRSLTINPDTGLPEAGMLSDLFKTIAPIALGAFLGPGAFGIAGLGLSAGTAGLVTGGLTTLATGSLSRGLMAGLGAYGGAGLAESFMGAGVGAAQQSAMGSLSADQIASEMANTELTKQGVLNQAAADATKSAMANTGQAVSSGFNAATSSPSAMGQFAKDNFKYLGAAAAPIMAGAMVPTTTKAAPIQSPGRIREKRWDGRQFVDVASTDANVYNTSGRNFSDLYRGYNGGGIVALANGGDAALEAYQAGRYEEANRLLAEAGMGAQDVVNKYGLSQADAATVAKNLGYAGDMSGIQYAPSAVASVPVTMQDNTAQTAMADTVADVGADTTQQTQEWTGGTPDMKQWMDATGITDPFKASGLLYGVTGSNFENDPRDWNSIMNSADPAAAAKAATAQMYGGPGRIELTGTGGMLVGADGTRLTSDLSRASEFGIALDPAQLKAQRDSISTTTPTGRAQYERIDALYQQALADQSKTTGLATLANAAGTTTAAAAKAGDTTGVAGLAANTAAASTPSYTSYSDAQVAKWFTDNPTATNAQVQKAITDSKIDPAAVNRYIASIADPFRGSTDTTGGSGVLGIYNQMKAQGIDPTELYKAEIANDPKYAGYTQPMIQKAYDLSKGAYALSDQLKGVVGDKDWVNFMDTNKYSVNDMAQAFGLSLKEVRDRYNAVKAAEKKAEVKTTGTGGTAVVDTTPKVTTGPIDTVDTTVLPPGVGGGGKTVVNENGTITTTPNIPGRPKDGFTGMADVRDAYTKGGGSLGYTSPKFDKIEDFNAKYVDRMSGDSRAAYDYLTGKAGATYPTKSGVGQISQDYATAVLGYPARGNLPYIYNKATGKMDVNPDYVAPGRDAAGNVTYSMSLNDIKSSLKETPLSGQALYDWAISNNLSAQQIADATGRSLSSVYSDFRAGSKAAAKKKEDDKAAGINTLLESGGGGGDGDGGGGGGGTGAGAGTGNAMASGGITGNGNLNLNIPLDIGGGGRGGELGGGGGYGGYGGVDGGLGAMPPGGSDLYSPQVMPQQGPRGFNQGPRTEADWNKFSSMAMYAPGTDMEKEKANFLAGGQGNQNSVQQSGMPNNRPQMDSINAQMQKLPSVTAYKEYGESISGRPPTADETAQLDTLRQAITKDKGFLDLQAQGQKYQTMTSKSPGLQQRYTQQGIQNQPIFASGGMTGYAVGGGLGSLGSYSDGGRLLRGPGDGVSDSIPATIGRKQQPARLADGEFVVPARIVSELGNGSTEAGAKKLYAMMDRVQRARSKTTGKNKVAANSRADKYLPA